MDPRPRLPRFLVLALVLAAGGCAGRGDARADARADAQEDAREDRLVVFAASSLREVFRSLNEGFARGHPGVEVTFHFAGTQELRTQLQLGATADVFASADAHHMDALVQAALVETPEVFAHNEAVVVTPREGAAKVHAFADLPFAARIVVGAPEVPIGRYTAQILERASREFGGDFRARVEERVVSRELQVAQVLARVSLGEAEAGIVYRTDARLARDAVRIVEIPPGLHVVAAYPIARVRGAAHPALARAWIAYLRSDEGQRTLGEAGFGPGGSAP